MSNSQSRATWSPAALVGLLLVLLLAAAQVAEAQQQTQPTDGQQQQQPRGLLSMFLSPLRATFDGARKLMFRNQLVDGAVNQLDQVRVEAFKVFMQFYNRTYSPEEIPKRMNLFVQRTRQIEQSVREYAAGKIPFMMRENDFIDWDQDELKALAGVSPPRSMYELLPEERELLMADESQRQTPAIASASTAHAATAASSTPSARSKRSPLDTDFWTAQLRPGNLFNSISQLASGQISALPALGQPSDDGPKGANVRYNVPVSATMDWRETGCIAPPRNQLKCGACYAIATMGTLESMRCLESQSSAPTLSPQQIVDCSTPRTGYQNFGCNGGWPTRVLKYLQDVGVAVREACYPFVRRQTACQLKTIQSSPTTSGQCLVNASPSNTKLRYKVLTNEQDILYHVAKTGPVVTVIKTTDRFLYYGSGIFDDPLCSRRRDDVDHAVQIVGYGRENGQDYWLIKNSWGTRSWGQNGYGKVRRGRNACSIGHWGWVILQ